MAGASLDVELTISNHAEVKAAFEALQARLTDLTPFFQNIGEALLNSTRERFRTQTAPDGTPWTALSPAYQARKKKHADLILTLNGYLRGRLSYRAEKDRLRLGTPLLYGAAHQPSRSGTGRARRGVFLSGNAALLPDLLG